MNCPDALTGASTEPLNFTVRLALARGCRGRGCRRNRVRFRWVWTGPTTDFIFFVVIGVGVIAVVLFRASRGE